MSKVVIQGNASGTGDFTIAAPNSNTNRTLTLPDVSGTLVTGDDIAINGITSDYTAGTALNIDSSGRVTMPYQPAFSASSNYGAGYLTIDISSGFPFNTTRINIGSHYSTSTYRFTAPITGLYEFSFSLFYESGLGASNHDCCIYVNGADLQGGPSASDQMASRPGTDRITTTQTTLIFLSANDYVDLRARQTSSGGIYGPHSMFCGRLVG